MKNKYKAAGIMNIACGVLFVLAYISISVLLFVGGILREEWVLVFLSMVSTLLGAYFWEIVIVSPFLMILTGVEMLSKHKKDWLVILLMIFNILLKLLIGWAATSMVLSIPFAIVYFISIIMDVRALFRKEN